MTTDILFGTASALLVLTVTVQTLREVFGIPSRFIPLVVFAVALLMTAAVAYLPDTVVRVLSDAFLLATGATAGVRYVKNGEERVAQGNTDQSLQGADPDVAGSGYPQGQPETETGVNGGSTGLYHLQPTESLPDPAEIFRYGSNPDG